MRGGAGGAARRALARAGGVGGGTGTGLRRFPALHARPQIVAAAAQRPRQTAPPGDPQGAAARAGWVARRDAQGRWQRLRGGSARSGRAARLCAAPAAGRCVALVGGGPPPCAVPRQHAAAVAAPPDGGSRAAVCAALVWLPAGSLPAGAADCATAAARTGGCGSPLAARRSR